MVKKELDYNHYLSGKKYDYSAAARTETLFHEEFINDLPMGRKRTRPYSPKKRKLVHSVFLNFLDIRQEEMIVSGRKYVLPTYPNALMYICEKTPLEMRRIHNNGTRYKFVNPILSDGKIYQMVFYCPRLRFKKRWIRISYKRYRQLADRVHNGQRYFHK